MATTQQLLFGVGVLSGGILLGGLVVSILFPSHRFWPHGDRDWTFWLGWTAWILYLGSLLGVAFLGWWGWYRPPTLVRIVSLLAVLAGAALSTWAALHLGFRESSGLEGRLDTEGPYRYSRNPQYVGYVVVLGGGAILAGSWMTAILAAAGIVWFLLAPFAEEPWLRAQYGDAYETYSESVPRFVGRTRGPPPPRKRTDRSKGEKP